MSTQFDEPLITSSFPCICLLQPLSQFEFFTCPTLIELYNIICKHIHLLHHNRFMLLLLPSLRDLVFCLHYITSISYLVPCSLDDKPSNSHHTVKVCIEIIPYHYVTRPPLSSCTCSSRSFAHTHSSFPSPTLGYRLLHVTSFQHYVTASNTYSCIIPLMAYHLSVMSSGHSQHLQEKMAKDQMSEP